jgi:hypothetical protein
MFHGMSGLNISMLQGRADTAVRLVSSDSKTTQVQNSFAFQQRGEIYVATVRLKLPDSRLQYYVRSLISMNPSQGIYGWTAAAQAYPCYNSVQPHIHHLLKPYTK